jgi:hypothetical protein
MTLASQIASDLDAVFFNTDDFATAVTYTHAGGSAQSIKALIDYGNPSPMEGMDALNTDAMMDIKVSDVPVVTPGDAIVIGAGTWNVIYANLIGDGLMWQCHISRRNR